MKTKQKRTKLSDAEQQMIMATASDLYVSMKKMIDSIVNKFKNFSNANDWCDYQQEAFLACYDAALRHSPYRTREESDTSSTEDADGMDNDGLSKMKLETFTYWFLLKKLSKLAKNGEEIVYHILKDNDFVKTLNNNQYRKLKKSLEEGGYTVRSARTTLTFSELASEKDGKVVDFIPAAIGSMDEGFESTMWG